LCGRNEGIHHRRALAAAIGVAEQPGFAAETMPRSIHVCNARKADANLELGSLSRRVMAVIAVSLQFGQYSLRGKTNWWDNLKKALHFYANKLSHFFC
jgi:hypothetical protein